MMNKTNLTPFQHVTGGFCKASAMALFLCLLLTSCYSVRVRKAVMAEMEKYPQSNLTDIYKSWFQSVFGPGHLLNDTTAALGYLRAELEHTKSYKDTGYWYPLGIKGRFGRLNLYVVASGKVPFNQFSDAFIKSSKEFSVPQNTDWKRQWNRILTVTGKMPVKPGNFEADKKSLDSLLSRNQYVIHHSSRFTEAYDPHYRVISTRIYREIEKSWFKGNSPFKVSGTD